MDEIKTESAVPPVKLKLRGAGQAKGENEKFLPPIEKPFINLPRSYVFLTYDHVLRESGVITSVGGKKNQRTRIELRGTLANLILKVPDGKTVASFKYGNLQQMRFAVFLLTITEKKQKCWWGHKWKTVSVEIATMNKGDLVDLL